MSRYICLIFVGILFCGAHTLFAEAKTVRLLTIGNSFSRNATTHLADLAEAGGHTLIHTPIVVGGASLELHATKAQAHEADEKDPNGLYSNSRSLKQELKAMEWDFITIQQASMKSHDIATYQPWASWLGDYLTQHAPKAKLLVHQTWAYRKDDPRFTKPSGKSGEPDTQKAMYEGLKSAYEQVATDLGGRIIPVGDAFFVADTDETWGFQVDPEFDPATAQPRDLPDQSRSLHMGWRWTKPAAEDKRSLAIDGHHASLAGQYLGACVWYEVLFGESVVGNAFVPKEIAKDYARFLQETAHQVVTARAGGNSPSKVEGLSK